MFNFRKTHKSISEAGLVSQVGCFGKLPMYDEFIRYKNNSRSVHDLEEWIQQGYSHYRRYLLHDQSYSNKAVYHFVFTGIRENEAPLIGTIMGSRDKCGRAYPFVIYKLLPKESSGLVISSLPCGYRKFYEKTWKMCSTDWSLQAINILLKKIEELNDEEVDFSKSGLLEVEMSALDAITKQKFWKDILQQSSVNNVASLVDAMKDLLDSVIRKSPHRTSWGIAISLPANQDYNTHVAFWVRTAESMLADRGWKPHIIWGNMNNYTDRKLFIFFRQVTPTFFSYLMGGHAENGVIIHLDDESILQNEVSDFAKEIASLDNSEHMLQASNQWANWRSY